MRYLVDALSVCKTQIDVEAPDADTARALVKALESGEGDGRIVKLSFDYFHPATEFTVNEIPFACMTEALDLRHEVEGITQGLVTTRGQDMKQRARTAVETYQKVQAAKREYDKLAAGWHPEAPSDSLLALKGAIRDGVRELADVFGLDPDDLQKGWEL